MNAIKNYVKMNRNKGINELILKDREQHYRAIMKYYKNKGKDKVGITVYPYSYGAQNGPQQINPFLF
jgi:hypothetical protein